MRLKRKSGRGAFWGDDGGFSTLGMAVALLVTLSLVFSAAQVYRVSSASADIQDVADACVLAAEGEVAEFMIAVRVCDAVVLSLSLTSAAMFGLGVVALCAPPAAELGIELVNLGTKVLFRRGTPLPSVLRRDSMPSRRPYRFSRQRVRMRRRAQTRAVPWLRAISV